MRDDVLAGGAPRPDLDSAESIATLVARFYVRVLSDPWLRPVFVEAVGHDLEAHLSRIRTYWQKMLFAEPAYRGNMIARHRALHARVGLRSVHLARWLDLFERTLDEGFAGPATERARFLARTIMGNLRRILKLPPPDPEAAAAECRMPG